MRKILPTSFIFLMLLAGCFAAKGGEKNSCVLTANHSSCDVTFASNPTTGYTWSALYDKNIISAKHEYFSPKTRLVGAGGLDVWTFTATEKALGAGKKISTVVKMMYSRSWEHGVPPIKTELVSVTIR
jgi:predicted secreted protein